VAKVCESLEIVSRPFGALRLRAENAPTRAERAELAEKMKRFAAQGAAGEAPVSLRALREII
jgi:hypothetical protein